MQEGKPILKSLLPLMCCRACLIIIIIALVSLKGYAQECSLTLSGYVYDLATELPLTKVNLYIQENGKGSSSDEDGFFMITDLCPGNYHLILSHIGCLPVEVFLELSRDSVLHLTMEHSVTNLRGVVVMGRSIEGTSKSVEGLNERELLDRAPLNLARMIESLAGVSVLKTGTGIGKPVVHGLYGNRLLVVNNGVAQSGQRWGNDHAPEIDPLAAKAIRVIKGASSVEYPGAGLGSVIIIDPRRIQNEPHLHGRVHYYYEGNGRGHGLNIQFQKKTPWLGWRVNGTLKKSGDKKSPQYFLNNTGFREANVALQLEKTISERWLLDGYFSTFNTTLGILRGSHIANISDLENALNRKIPFFTEKKFSYIIEAPRQRVNHHFMKLESKTLIDESQWLTLVTAVQLNKRKEFDIRRSGRTDIPALSLKQTNYLFDAKYQKLLLKDWNLKFGFQLSVTDNTNDPETGVLPLIPDYLSYNSGIFFLANKHWDKAFFEWGLRYELDRQSVAVIENSVPYQIRRYKNNFQNFSSNIGWTFGVGGGLPISFNLGYAARNPAINELYSQGLHQGVSGIETGNPGLDAERGLKATLGLEVVPRAHIRLSSLAYYQGIRNYILLKPQNDFRLTIRGAFPVFRYEQTHASIYGLDVSAHWDLTDSFYAKFKYSFLRGQDLVNDLPLINMPSNNMAMEMGFQFPKPIETLGKKIEHLECSITNQYYFKQVHLLPKQDFIAAPEGYYLLSLNIAFDMWFGKIRSRFYGKVDNALNVQFRNYLNRQRYFSDDLGFNASLGIGLTF